MLKKLFKGVPDAEQLLFKLFIKYYSQADYGDDLKAITKPQQMLCFAYEFVKEVNNGGFHQYFFNSAGNNAHQAVEAIQSIGASESASLLQLAISVWPAQQVPQDWETRRDVLAEIEEAANMPWDNCTKRFYNGNESITALLIAYIDSHPTEFRE
jgi:hypothetical protein